MYSEWDPLLKREKIKNMWDGEKNKKIKRYEIFFMFFPSLGKKLAKYVGGVEKMHKINIFKNFFKNSVGKKKIFCNRGEK